jgi:hypothetical protein
VVNGMGVLQDPSPEVAPRTAQWLAAPGRGCVSGLSVTILSNDLAAVFDSFSTFEMPPSVPMKGGS